MQKVIWAGAVTTCFSFHALFNGRMFQQETTSDRDFPTLGQDQLPSCLKDPQGILHLSSIVIPICGVTYVWSSLRARKQDLKHYRRIGIASTIAIGYLMGFDVLSWLYRLRIYGPKEIHALVDDVPTQITREKTKNEIQWYRTNQIYVPSFLTITGALTGQFPFLLIPIVSWKAFWHMWVLYQRRQVLLDLQCGPMAPYRELEAKYGKESAFQIYCESKNLTESKESRLLYERALNNK